MKVQDGCNRFCSYCIIPYARGRVRSRKIQSVVDEVTKIVADGLKEVVITGIHIASYGKDFKEDLGIIDLLESLNKIDNLERIRLRFTRANTYYRRIYTKTYKIRQNMQAFSFIIAKWL